MKSPIILRIFKNNQLVEVKQFLQDQVVIGRQADVHVDLDDDKVSAIHCMLEFREERYHICDLGSSSGTFKNGQAILDEVIESGDEVVVGPFKLSFLVGVPKPKGIPDKPADTTLQSAGAAAVGATINQASVKTPEPKAPEPKVAEAPKATQAPKITETQKSTPPPTPSIPATPPKPGASSGHISASTSVAAAKPIIKSQIVSSSTHPKKGKRKTFAPPNQVEDLKSYLSPTKGPVAEVLVAWQERIMTTKHYRTATSIRAADLDLPGSVFTGVLVEFRQGIRINVPSGADFSLVSETSRLSLQEVKNANRLQSDARGNFVRIEQGEIGFLDLGGATKVQIVVRYVPATAIVPLIPPMMLSAGEVSGVVLSMVLVGILAFLINTLAPAPEAEVNDELTRVAQVVLQKPPERPKDPTPPPEPTPKEPVAPPPPKTPPPPPKKVVVSEQKQQAVSKGTPAQSQKAASAGRAAEVAPNPNAQNKPKKFTSIIKQGGAVKLGATAGANAQSKDVTQTGLFSAFGSEGTRAKLDKAYSGSGEVLGSADRATGTSGMESNRGGDDLGSKFKDTGAGGKGTATQGISGINTKGRGSGMNAYGNDFGTGEKSSVAVVSGGAEEDFVGTIDREAVRRAVRSHKNEIEGCYTRVLNRMDRSQRQALEGKVVLSWDIVERGQAKNVSVRETTLKNKEIEDCVRSRLATWQFPEPPAGMTATVQSYPFYFRSQN